VRAIKSEVLVDLAQGQAEELAARDPDWLINGRWGIVQLVAGTG